MKRLFHSISVIATAITICVLLSSGGCTTSSPEGFAIYLTRGDIPPSQMEALSHIEIIDQPVIAMSDVVSYDAVTHEIELTEDAYNRIVALEVPVRGKSFVVCVDRNPIYWGAFWTPISSIAFDGVTIWKPFILREPYVISLELGYPSSSFYGGEDPRNNEDVMGALEQAGKLITTEEKLPHSMKGYELYSWQEDDGWHFTLITGTNRNKTPEEVVSQDEIISEDGWVHLHVVGVDAIKDVLNKLQQGEFVSWCDGMRLTEPNAEIQLPSEEIVAAVKEHAGQCGLDFLITVS